MHFGKAHDSGPQTADTQKDHATASVAIGRISAVRAMMRPNNDTIRSHRYAQQKMQPIVTRCSVVCPCVSLLVMSVKLR